MTDDLCGHPTEGGDGPPCQNPASEGDHCWIDTHGGDVSPGREFSISPDDHDAILDAATDGMSKSGCARAAGVSRPELNRYLDAHPDFRSAFMRARSEGERELVRRALYDDPDPAAPDINDQHARFLLSTSFDYVKTERREHLVDDEAELSDTQVVFDYDAEIQDSE